MIGEEATTKRVASADLVKLAGKLHFLKSIAVLRPKRIIERVPYSVQPVRAGLLYLLEEGSGIRYAVSILDGRL
ncbi:hypothetical protein ACVWZM_008435 [Bradyrhizobium sp. USDA 4501]